MNQRCLIVGAGDFFYNMPMPQATDYIIAADGGYSYLREAGITPHVVIGDMDSVSEMPVHEQVIRLPREKDDTDMMAAIKLAIEKGCNSFHIYGGTGGRMDHTIANIQSVAYITKTGAEGYLYDKDMVLTAVADGSLEFEAGCEGMLSVFSLSDAAEGVTLTGLKYLLNDAQVTNSFPVGISNEFIGVKSRITVKKGMLLVLYPISCVTPVRT